MFNLLNSMNHFNATGEVIACDESLEEHDKKYHPDGFDPKTDSCSFFLCEDYAPVTGFD